MAAGDSQERVVATAPAQSPSPAAASAFLEGLAAQDWSRLGSALAPGVRLRALLPGGPREWTGADAVADRFARWFGDTEQHELRDRAVDEIAGRMRVRWRIGLEAERLGPGRFVVEQVAYADLDAHGLLSGIDLVCTGYLPEPPRG